MFVRITVNYRITNKYASYPDCCISPHANCPASLSHLTLRLPSALSIFHFVAWGLTLGQSSPNSAEACSRRLSTILKNFSPVKQMVYKMLPKFFTFWLVADPFAKVHQKWSSPATNPGLPSCQISSPCINPCRRYPLQKICGQTNKVTVVRTGYIPTCRSPSTQL